VAASFVAVSRPPGHSTTAINGSAKDPQAGARQRQDAVFANIAAVLDSVPPQDPRVRPEKQFKEQTAQPAAQVEAAAISPAMTPLADEASDRAIGKTATGYRPDADKRRTVYYLAAAMAALSLYCMGPAIAHSNLGSAPNWARAALLLSVLQLAYVAWAASIPDWTTLRASMVLFTVAAAVYGLTMTVSLSTPAENTLPLDLTEVRRQAVLWCASIVLLASLLAYGCGRAAWRWRRTLELLYA
jgi:hypothetical protein